MEDIKETVRENLIQLRKKNGLKQTDLAKRINYSDKAISRWENGEVVPDLDVLQNLSTIYEVPISYLFSRHETAENKTTQKVNKIAFCCLLVCIVFTIATIAYVYCNIMKGLNLWQFFVWAVPFSTLLLIYCNNKYYKNILANVALQSIFTWTGITCLYLTFLSYNLWLVYLIGVPIQFSIIVSSFIRSEKLK